MTVQNSDFEKDKALVATVTGATLTHEQFDQYSSRILLHKEFGEVRLRTDYLAFGIPRQLGLADRFNDVLGMLARHGVVFNVAEEPGLKATFGKTIDAFLGQNQWPHVPGAYHQSTEVIDLVKERRALYGCTLETFSMR